jgi:uncharacterized protein YrrD
MINVIRRSQMIGLMAMDRSTATGYGTIDEVWVDDSGRVSYFSSDQGYLPIDEVAVVGPDAVLSYSYLAMDTPRDLFRQLHRIPIRMSRASDPVGWIEDFLFDWETGDVVAYILGGDIASPFGDRAVLFPDDVEVIDTDAVVIKEDAKDRLKSESEGLKGFLSEKSQQVKHFVKEIKNRAQSLITPDDQPETVRVKVKQVGDELTSSGKHDHNAIQEATAFLQDKWDDLQHRTSKAGKRMKKALDKAWHRLTK